MFETLPVDLHCAFKGPLNIGDENMPISLDKSNIKNNTLCDSCENSLFISSVHSFSVCVRRLACASPKCHLSCKYNCVAVKTVKISYLLTAKITFGQNPGPKMFSKSLIMLFSPWVNLGDWDQVFVWLRRLNISPPARWRGWQRRWPAWSPPSGTSPTAPQSHDRSQHHLQSLVRSWSETADRLNRLSWSWFWFI